MHPPARPLTWPHAAGRLAAAVFGGYVFTWGFATLGTALGLRAGLPYGDAQTLAHLLAFLVFLGAFCWAFAAARLARVWAVLAGGGALATAAGWWLAQP